MTEEKYYIVEINEDGDISVYENSAEDMQVLINNEDEDYYGEGIPEIDANDCNKTIPDDADPACWTKKILIIKGHIVVPKAVTKITAFEIE